MKVRGKCRGVNVGPRKPNRYCHVSRVCHSAMSDPHKSTALPSPTRSPTAPEPNLGPSRSDSTEVSVSVSVSAAAATTSDDAAEPEFRVYKPPETAAQQGS